MSSESNSESFDYVSMLVHSELMTTLALTNLLLPAHVSLEGQSINQVTSTPVDLSNVLSG